MKIMVSACLAGENCKYNGGNNRNKKVLRLMEENEVITVCPEQMGGLPTPRVPSEVRDGVVTARDGRIVDKEFRAGAAKCLEIAIRERSDLVILQSRSPSCGVKQRYDGTFTGKLVDGAGVTAELLMEHGFRCLDVEDLVEFKQNKDYTLIIEKKAENLYRTISQKIKNLPTSNPAVKQSVLRTQQLNLTPQESEQLSKYVSDDTYVKQQKEDIEELASMFKDMLGKPDDDMDTPFVKELESHFVSTEDFAASYSFIIEGIKKPLYVAIQNGELEIHYGQEEKIDVVAKLSRDVLQSIIDGRMTFQRAFMTGEMTAKGNFKTLRMLDQIFVF